MLYNENGGDFMARQPRILSANGMYHIIFRGIKNYDIFNEKKDYLQLLMILENLKEQYAYDIYAYCLMSNHVHLLIKEQTAGDISIIMKLLFTKYAGWFNRKYERCGILIENCFNSQMI